MNDASRAEVARLLMQVVRRGAASDNVDANRNAVDAVHQMRLLGAFPQRAPKRRGGQ